MTQTEANLLNIKNGSVIAPAGCGKTHLIATSLAQHNDKKPVLVLTHTNSGVAALMQKFKTNGVSSKSYQLATIDGWAMKLISTFPKRSGHNPKILDLSTPKTDYPDIRKAAVRLITEKHINDVIKASYSMLIVDEYQDCNIVQHELIKNLSLNIPVCVLGDPMQGIFNFNDDMVNWKKDVRSHFPDALQLDKPWRWHNTNNPELGEWLLKARGCLSKGQPVDLRTAPKELVWIKLSGQSNSDHSSRLNACNTKTLHHEDHVIIIGDSKDKKSQWNLANTVSGAVTIEAVDLTDFIKFTRDLDFNDPKKALVSIINFSKTLMSHIEADKLLKRIQSLQNGTARKEPNIVEKIALEFIECPSYPIAAKLLSELKKMTKVRVYRPTVFHMCCTALESCAASSELSLYDSAITLREQYRHLGRKLPKRGVGSTLLVKGLESEIVIIPYAENLKRNDLYVALTRGSKKIVICSKSPVLNPS